MMCVVLGTDDDAGIFCVPDLYGGRSDWIRLNPHTCVVVGGEFPFSTTRPAL